MLEVLLTFLVYSFIGIILDSVIIPIIILIRLQEWDWEIIWHTWLATFIIYEISILISMIICFLTGGNLC